MSVWRAYVGRDIGVAVCVGLKVYSVNMDMDSLCSRCQINK